jgi:hypothetical protein
MTGAALCHRSFDSTRRDLGQSTGGGGPRPLEPPPLRVRLDPPCGRGETGTTRRTQYPVGSRP